ncbi:50S ribosomal protein L1 [candidate division LCP-89 bacterium B3_LCP]|uniref:Large ribosomal subunit protein uL1 n=1 Tax=candidate division LCP-89 bacterium B3_LCP TaxID=2012998 RepID=A0A532UZT7_UNCL8|nr:MAG: 50S ribosomal protein L1 [candidate division LCP-89 bacterium B3_LCP]
MKHSRRYNEQKQKIDRFTEYEFDEALQKVKDSATAKFDESIEISVNLGVDPRHADQMVRGAVALPHGTGKVVRVLVFAKEAKQDEAKDAGADHVGLEDYVEKIQKGWTDIDAIIATPDVMAQVGKLGRVLGPRGLMPNPKSGTVTMDVGDAVKAIKGGRIDFRTDKFGILHVIIGKKSFELDKLKENLQEFVRTIMRLRPAAAKGQYIKAVTLSSTLGPGIKVDKQSLLNSLK